MIESPIYVIHNLDCSLLHAANHTCFLCTHGHCNSPVIKVALGGVITVVEMVKDRHLSDPRFPDPEME